eukprot:1392006-Pleurochrysis_carterae.AAC.1
MAKQDRREAGGAAVETINLHVHPRAADCSRHSRCESTKPTFSSSHGAAERRSAPRGERRNGQGRPRHASQSHF